MQPFFERKVTAGEKAPTSLQKYGRAKDLFVAFMSKQYGIDNIDAIKINSAFVYNLETSIYQLF